MQFIARRARYHRACAVACRSGHLKVCRKWVGNASVPRFARSALGVRSVYLLPIIYYIICLEAGGESRTLESQQSFDTATQYAMLPSVRFQGWIVGQEGTHIHSRSTAAPSQAQNSSNSSRPRSHHHNTHRRYCAMCSRRERRGRRHWGSNRAEALGKRQR